MKLLGHRRIEMSLRYAKITPNHLRDEYLKATKRLENRYVSNQGISDLNPQYTEPAHIICSLISFTNRSAKIDRYTKKEPNS